MSARKIGLAVAAIALVFVIAAVVLDRIFSEPPGPTPAPRAAAPAAAPAPEAPAPLPPLPPLPAPAGAAPPPVGPGAAAATTAPATARKQDLYVSLEALRRRILACAGPAAAAAEPSEDGDRSSRIAARRGQQRTVVRLDLRPFDDEVSVYGVEVVSQGPGGEALVRCARQELSGRTLEAGGAKAGDRFTMDFDLGQRRR